MALCIFFVLRLVRLLLVLPVMHLMKPLNVSKVGRCLVLQWVIYSSSKPNLGTCHLIPMQVHFSFIVLPGPKTIVQTGLHVKLPWLNYLQQKRHQRVIRRSCTNFWLIRCGFLIRCWATLSGNPCAQDLWRCFWGSKTNYCLADTQGLLMHVLL